VLSKIQPCNNNKILCKQTWVNKDSSTLTRREIIDNFSRGCLKVWLKRRQRGWHLVNARWSAVSGVLCKSGAHAFNLDTITQKTQPGFVRSSGQIQNYWPPLKSPNLPACVLTSHHTIYIKQTQYPPPERLIC